LCGKIVAVKDASRVKEIGTVILPGATKSGDDQWKGRLLNTDDDKAYAGVVALEGDEGLGLKGSALGNYLRGRALAQSEVTRLPPPFLSLEKRAVSLRGGAMTPRPGSRRIRGVGRRRVRIFIEIFFGLLHQLQRELLWARTASVVKR
jgi:hypothetical protein